MADNQGWHGDSEGHAKAGSQSSGNQGNPTQDYEAGEKGGEARKQQGTDYSALGQQGGTTAQQSGNAHELTDEERSRGGQH